MLSSTPSVLLSPSSTSSYDLVSSISDRAESDDEIVWHGRSSSSQASTESSLLSDSDEDDFVVLSRARSSARRGSNVFSEESLESSDDEHLSSALSGLSLSEASMPRSLAAFRGLTIERPSSTATVKKVAPSPQLKTTISVPNKQKQNMTKEQREAKKAKKAAKKAKKASKKARKAAEAAVQARSAPSPSFPIVDDAYSDTSDESSSTVSGYEDASNYISSFLTTPESKASVSKLTLLHSLIIELGVSSSSSPLPGSLTAAKALLKSRAHVNIREYVTVRKDGQAALQKIMHPSRSALVKSIRKKKNPASLKWVKEQGLNVLLVTCFC